jgi:hypothetical protein
MKQYKITNIKNGAFDYVNEEQLEKLKETKNGESAGWIRKFKVEEISQASMPGKKETTYIPPVVEAMVSKDKVAEPIPVKKEVKQSGKPK